MSRKVKIVSVPKYGDGGKASIGSWNEKVAQQPKPNLPPIDPAFLRWSQFYPQDRIREAAPEKPTSQKIADIVRNPMTALSYKMQGKDVPQNIQYADRNKYDYAADIVNPMTYLDALKRVGTLQHFRQDGLTVNAALKTALDAGMIYSISNPFLRQESHYMVPAEDGPAMMVNPKTGDAAVMDQGIDSRNIVYSPEMTAKINERVSQIRNNNALPIEQQTFNDPFVPYKFQSTDYSNRLVPGITYQDKSIKPSSSNKQEPQIIDTPIVPIQQPITTPAKTARDSGKKKPVQKPVQKTIEVPQELPKEDTKKIEWYHDRNNGPIQFDSTKTVDTNKKYGGWLSKYSENNSDKYNDMKRVKITGLPKMATGGITPSMYPIMESHNTPAYKASLPVQQQYMVRRLVPDPITGEARMREVPATESQYRENLGAVSSQPVYNYPKTAFPNTEQQVGYTPQVNQQQTGYTAPVRGTQNTQQANWHSGDNTDYSIDSVRRDEGLMRTGGTMKRKVQITAAPQMKYGGSRPGPYNQFSFDAHSWNPNNYGAAAGVEPKPDPYITTGKTLPEVPEDQANAVLEKNEKVAGQFTPDGLPALLGVNAGTHESGDDAPVKLGQGDFVYSDTRALKIKDPEVLKHFGATKPMTPAKIAGRYDLQKFTKVIADPNSDSVERKTAQLMVENYQSKLNDLATYQEIMKQQKGLSNDNKQTMTPMGERTPMIGRTGGRLPQYKTGDPITSGVNDNSYVDDDIYEQGYRKRPRTAATMDNSPLSFTMGIPDNVQQSYNYMASDENLVNDPIAIQQMKPNKYVEPATEAILQPPVANNLQADDQTTDNMSVAGNGKPKQTYVPFSYTGADMMGIANSALNAATLRKYPAWQAPVGAVAPSTVFMDPTRALAAQQEHANSESYNDSMSANSRANRAASLARQGVAGSTAADIIGKYQNENAQIANQASEKVAAISNRLQELQTERANKLYEGNVTAAQQYDNAIREGRNDLTRQYQNAWKNRQNIDMLNKTSPYFYIDPVSGQRQFKSQEAQARFNNEIGRLSQGSGVPSGTIERYMSAYHEAVGKGIPQDDAQRYARDASGMSDRDREKLDRLGILQSETRSLSGVERQKYGGQFAGMSAGKLKKFITSHTG